MLQFIPLLIQVTPPPPGPPGPPGLPIDNGILILLTAAIMYGCYVAMTRNLEDGQHTNWNVFSIHISKYWSKLKNFIQKMRQIMTSRTLFLIISILLLSTHTIQAQSDINTKFDIDTLATDNIFIKEQIPSNTWAIGGGLSNFIMHGDLRSIGTGNQGNFWNFGGYLYIDKMFNPVLGLELKINYNKLSGGAQYFSEVYEVLYTNTGTINNNLFFEGRSYGAELNLILSLSNIYRRQSEKWHLASYLGVGYHQYNSVLYEKNPDGSRTELVDFGFNPARNNENEASSIYLSAQLGLKYRISKKIDIEFRSGFYLNYEDHLDATISDKQDLETFFVNHIGLVYKFGKKQKYTIWGKDNGENDTNTKKGNPFEIKDSDGDGVMDELDVQPMTPKGVKVYGDGSWVDSDKDKVPDYKDKCPFKKGSPALQGCPPSKDTDGDGVYDDQDDCITIPGPKSNKGCPEIPNSVLKELNYIAKLIFFETDRAVIKARSYNDLGRIADIMKQFPKVKFYIDGHTDSKGNDSYNMSLSRRRAMAVKEFLENLGVNGKQLEARGFGETRPIASNNSEGGRQLNRRVRIELVN
ncbi:OmpA family protein [uncultured Kordia sp.]|uniref:OmpA family protein n=1 Tax=uncultured Kordia sp. TaxID=507699 RepID=UPI00260E674D|nr:OmpA family protein [uncultured Kordia sp.]